MHYNNFGNFYTREIYAITIPIGFIPIPIPIPIMSRMAIPIPMEFPWEWDSHGVSHSHAHLYWKHYLWQAITKANAHQGRSVDLLYTGFP